MDRVDACLLRQRPQLHVHVHGHWHTCYTRCHWTGCPDRGPELQQVGRIYPAVVTTSLSIYLPVSRHDRTVNIGSIRRRAANLKFVIYALAQAAQYRLGMNKTLSTVAKIRTAFARRNLLATAIGMVKGGSIPAGTFALYHLEMNNDPWQLKGLIVLGGLIYSAKTVFGWCKQVFRLEDGTADTWKALGWCAGIEGFMTASSTFWLNCAALALLILVNAVATGVSLAMEDEAMKAAEAPVAKPVVIAEVAPVITAKPRRARPPTKTRKPRAARNAPVALLN